MAKRRRVKRRQLPFPSIDKILSELHDRKEEVDFDLYDALNRSWFHSGEVVSFYFDVVTWLEDEHTL